MPLSPNSRLGPYQVGAQIGAGGMGEVYQARDTRLNRDVAIKVMPAEVAADPDRVRRFEDEARAVATLAHPNILAIHDVGEQSGLHYLVTELLEGETLRETLKDGPLPPRRAIEYAVQIANGLAAAHAKGIVHRDLKPDNIFLTRDGHAKILDFGLAKQQKSAAASAEGATMTSSHTAPGTVMGTAAYMAPEQVRGEATDQRTDIFALGLILYEMLAGGPAFKRDSSVETMNAILKEDAPEFASGSSVPPAVERIIRRCLTFRNGYIRMARFTPDGQGIVYGAMWEGGPMQRYQGRIDSMDSQPIATEHADLLSVAKTGELAVALDRRFLSPWVPIGTVARMPQMGGAPRPVFPDAIDADWSPDGSALAVVYRSHGRARLEYPVGKPLYENDGYLSHPRFSPDGKHIAVAEHPVFGDDRGWITLVGLDGEHRKLSTEYGSLQGMAWTPDGKELWLASGYDLIAIDMKGTARILYRALSRIRIQDISANGKVLLTTDDIRSEIFAATTGGPESHNLAPFPFSAGSGITADGQLIAINTFQTDTYGMWIRKADGSPAIHVGDGALLDISADGKMLLGFAEGKPDQLILVPTGFGETRTLPSVGLQYQYGSFLPGAKRALVLASSSGHANRLYVVDLAGQSPPRPISEEGVSIGQYSRGVTPDGKYVIAGSPDPQDPAKTIPKLYPIEGGDPRPVLGVESSDLPISWLPDGRSILVLRMGESPATVYKVEVSTGKREAWRKFVPADSTGILTMRSAYVTPDGKHYTYTTRRVLSTLYVIDGLK